MGKHSKGIRYLGLVEKERERGKGPIERVARQR